MSVSWIVVWGENRNTVGALYYISPLSTNPITWSNTLKQFVGNSRRIECVWPFWCWRLKGSVTQYLLSLKWLGFGNFSGWFYLYLLLLLILLAQGALFGFICLICYWALYQTYVPELNNFPIFHTFKMEAMIHLLMG